jgi:hypothetical protein
LFTSIEQNDVKETCCKSQTAIPAGPFSGAERKQLVGCIPLTESAPAAGNTGRQSSAFCTG